MAEFFQSMPGLVFCFFLALPALFIVVPIAVGMRDAKALRAVSEKRADLIADAGAGLVSLEGVATEIPRGPTTAGLTGRPCCWFYSKVEKYENRGSEDSGWEVIQEDWSSRAFLLTDATGVCIIRPECATVTAAHRNLWYGTTPQPQNLNPSDGGYPEPRKPVYRYVEDRIHPGDLIFVRGQLVRGRSAEGWDEEDELGEEEEDEDATSLALPTDAPSVIAPSGKQEPFIISSGTQADAFDAASHAVQSAMVAASLGAAGVAVLLWLRFGA